MKNLLKKSGTLALTLILCFTMLFADIGTASAETKIITGTFGMSSFITIYYNKQA